MRDHGGAPASPPSPPLRKTRDWCQPYKPRRANCGETGQSSQVVSCKSLLPPEAWRALWFHSLLHSASVWEKLNKLVKSQTSCAAIQALWVPGDGTRRRLLRAKSFEVCFVLLLILFLPVNQAEETQIYAYEYLDLHVCHVFLIPSSY